MKRIVLFLMPLSVLAQPAEFIPPELRTYLNLTEDQALEIQRNNAAFRESLSASVQRVNDLNREVGEETQRPMPDPGSLGLRYQEIELLCRQREAPAAEVHRQNLRVLSDEQRALLRRLEEATSQFRLAAAASGLLLVSSTFNLPILGLGLDAAPLLSADVSPDLAAYLQLTPAQVEQLRNNLRAHQNFLSSRLARMGEVSQELQVELARESVQALAVGDRYSEIEAHRRQIAARASELRRQNLAILTAEQNRRLQDLSVRPDSTFLSFYAEQLNLLTPVQARPASRPGSSLRSRLLPFGIPFIDALPGDTAATSIYRSCQAGPPTGVIVITPLLPLTVSALR